MTTDGGGVESGEFPVFISFARPDGRRPALDLRRELAKLGIQAFLDERDGPLTRRWEPAVGAALKQATVIVVVMTAHSCPTHERSSRDQYTEIRRALSIEKKRSGAVGIFIWLRKGAPEVDTWPMGLDNFTGRSLGPLRVAKLLEQDLLSRATASAPPLVSNIPNKPGSTLNHSQRHRNTAGAARSRAGGSGAGRVADPDQRTTSDPTARAVASRKVRDQLSRHPDAAGQLAKAASLALDPAKEICDQLDPLVRHVLDHDVAAVLLAMEKAWTDCGPADRLAVAACAGARLELDASSRPELAVVRDVLHRPVADRKLKVPSMVWPLTIGFVNARAHGVSAPVAPLALRGGVEPIVEGTYVWDEKIDLPVLATWEAAEVQLAERLGADLGTYRQHKPPEGRSAIERIVAATGGSGLSNVDLLINECKRILSEGRVHSSDAFKRIIIVVHIGGYKSTSEATAAFERAAWVVGRIFQDSAPPVFFLAGSQAAAVEGTINHKMRAMLGATPS
jgi:hypothetical protein